jgi:hypothetical protein
VDTDFYLYYGNDDAVEPDSSSPTGSTGVWTDFAGVWHLEERPDNDDGCGFNQACSSASDEHPGQFSDDLIAPSRVSGFLGASLALDGRGDALAVPSLSNEAYPQLQGTLSMLFKLECKVNSANESQLFDSYRQSENHFFIRCNKDRADTNLQMAVQSADLVNAYEFSHSVLIDETAWNHIVVRHDTDVDLVTFALNGTIISSRSVAPDWIPSGQRFMVGRDTAGSPVGRIDEVRMSTTARSDEWIAASAANVRTPQEFYAVSLPEDVAGD